MKETELQGAKAVIKAVFQTSAELARDIKRPRKTIEGWTKNNQVPAISRAVVVKAAKKRGFKITAEQLRGDL